VRRDPAGLRADRQRSPSGFGPESCRLASTRPSAVVNFKIPADRFAPRRRSNGPCSDRKPPPQVVLSARTNLSPARLLDRRQSSFATPAYQSPLRPAFAKSTHVIENASFYRQIESEYVRLGPPRGRPGRLRFETEKLAGATRINDGDSGPDTGDRNSAEDQQTPETLLLRSVHLVRRGCTACCI
jgi:hypothetical protein